MQDGILHQILHQVILNSNLQDTEIIGVGFLANTMFQFSNYLRSDKTEIVVNLSIFEHN